MVKTSWTDIDKQGRTMARIVALCQTNITKHLNEKDNDLVLAYIDRLIKASAHQAQLTNMNLKLNMLFKLAEKKHADEIINIGLKELSDKKK